MTDDQDQRAEAAFRAAFLRRAGEAPSDHVDVGLVARRRTPWIAGAVAAVVVGIIAVPVVLSGDNGGGGESRRASEGTSGRGPQPPTSTRWVSYRGIEIAVPQSWGYDYNPGRPDCIYADELRGGRRPDGVPDAPFVEIDASGRAVTLQGCMPDPDIRGPEEFGQLPFALWEPYVSLESASRNLAPVDGEWSYRGWTLTRRTVAAAQITVLAEDPAVADEVFGSVRSVAIDTNGCKTTSDAASAGFSRPATSLGERPSPIVAVCLYDRRDPSGLVGSRQMTGADAERLWQAIQDAPEGGGPDTPKNCTDDYYGDQAIALRFLPEDWTPRDVAYPEVYVYYDWCFGNGIFDATTTRSLTRDSCRPLFEERPINIWSASGGVAALCWPR
ncbi:hypothetical protein F0U44_01935 [Nocardioides humilatus]|uniref:Uncharacterized protein n=1 Tax=Nocardioides humilatus TaxID=2607660 RepID=A0A5B1LKY3_9ACTN|nr:hypothetical protein [Nocardioides humilatus]KAA1421106.1 hypothetical protein F0U44_01935 [Nocardioides humilatus]